MDSASQEKSWQDGLLEEIFQHSHECIVLLDRDFNFVRVNQAYADVCARDIGEFPGRNHFELYPSPFIEDCKKVVDTGVPFHAMARPFIFPDHPEWGETYWDLSLVPILDRDGQMNLLLFTLKDVTESHRMLRELQRANRALKAISLCNSMLIRAAEEHELLEGMCRIVVEAGGYLMAWIGFAEMDEEKTVKPVAQSGHEENYLGTIRISWGDGELGRGPTGTAIRTGTAQINQNCLKNPNMRPWLKAALERGYQSNIALPLVSDGKAFGALTIYASEPDAFQEEEVALLEQLAADLSYGVSNLRSCNARQKAEEALEEIGERYRKLFEEGTDAIALADAETGEIIDVNRAMEDLVGWKKSEIAGKPQKMLHPPEQGEHAVSSSFERHRAAREGKPIETQVVTRDGLILEVEIKASSINLDGRKVLIGFFRDISDRKRYESQFAYQSTHDNLTGLANRNLLSDRIAQSMIHAHRTHRWLAVMLLDLDRFKLVNDSLGHATGDKLICEVARRFSACLRLDDTAARLGGDEFAILVADLSNEEDAILLTHKLLDSLKKPVVIAGREIIVSVSMGISIYPRDGNSPSELIKNADAAMYRAKGLGGNSFQFYSPEMNVRMLERLELENDLRRALERNEFELFYQPKVDLQTGRINGVEALIRWNHPELGLVPPGSFIPLAEETGLIVPVGEWVIDAACAQIRAWNDLGDITVAINLSARQFQQKNLLQVIVQALQMNEIEAKYLELEVTESAVMASPEEAISILKELKKIGVRISLDDFGTGYSSLNYLKRFPIDFLKIDQSFVRDITIDPDDAAIAKLVIGLAHSMNRKVIAEGVESEAQLKFLQQEHCDEMQGYYFSRPVSAGEIARMLSSEKCLDISRKAPETPALLLVDDEENILNALVRVLRRDGYRILKTTSAREALNILATSEVGVILSDQRMPEMDGVSFLRRAKQLHPDSMRIVLSGYTDLKSVTDAINEGAVYKFLTKPWEDELLRENIGEAFQRYEMKRDRDRLVKALAETNEKLSRSKAELESMVKTKTDEASHTLDILKILQEVLECLPIGVIGIDDEGLIAVANEHAEQLFGKGLIGMPAYEKLPPVMHEGIREILQGTRWEIRDPAFRGLKSCRGYPLEPALGGKGALLVVN